MGGAKETAPQGHADVLRKLTADLEVATEADVVKALSALHEDAQQKLLTALCDSQPAPRGHVNILRQLAIDVEAATEADLVKTLSALNDDVKKKLVTAVGDSASIVKLKAIFSKLDANNSGYVSKEDFAAALNAEGSLNSMIQKAGLMPVHFILEQLEASGDSNGGRVSWQEFSRMLEPGVKPVVGFLRKIFDSVDADNDGRLIKRELA